MVLASARPLKDFEVIVDATSGRVLSKRNLLQHASGSAKLYVPNPIATNGGYSGFGRKPRADHHDHNTSALTAARQAVTLMRIKPGQRCLVGQYVDARLGKYGSKVCRKSLDWSSVKRSNDQFEALMTYYHIDSITNYFHLLGFTGVSDVHPRRQKTFADAIPDDNSFYSPATRTIIYGTGGVDDAEDGDVITHEFGHAIQDSQDPGFGTSLQAASLGEGFGDFMSAINTTQVDASTIPPSYLATARDCVFDWDGVGGYGGPGVAPCGRVSDGSDGVHQLHPALAEHGPCDIKPHQAGGIDIHCVGEVWTHGLNDLVESLPPAPGGEPPIFDDLLTSQFLYVENETFTGAVDGLVQVDQAIFAGSHVAAICAEMTTARGFSAPSCP